MKNAIFLILILLFTATSGIIAQKSEPDFQTVLQNANVIVEGQVLYKTYEKDVETGTFFTLNHLRVDKVLKGVVGKAAIIKTEGGQIDNVCQVVSHTLQFSKGEEGLFILELVDASKANEFKLARNANKVVKIKFDRDREGFDFNANLPIKSWRQFYETVSSFCQPGQQTIKKQSIPENLVDVEICFLLANPIVQFASQSVQFDVYAKSNIAGVKFSDASIEIKYPTDVFGGSVVSNGNLQASKEIVASNPAYVLSTQDLANDRFGIEIGTDCHKYEDSYSLSTDYEKLVRITMVVENWAALLNWQSQSIQAIGSAKYFETVYRCADFSRICFDYRLDFAPCNITSVKVAPFAAGILQTITFEGSSFGGNLGQNPLAKVDIPNAEDGGTTNIVLSGADQDYVVNWQDNEVVLRISSMAYGSQQQTMGSGLWKITPNFISSTDFCSIVVDIDFALLNNSDNGTEKMIGLALIPTTDNPDAALEWYIDDGINLDPVLQANGVTFAGVEQVAIQAFCDWGTSAGIEFRYMGPLNNANNNSDKKNALFFGNPGGSSLAQTTTVFNPNICDDDPIFRGRFLEFNINVDKQRKWYTSTNTAIGAGQEDLYSVLIHEIGHGHLLKHAMDTDPDNGTDDDRTMFFRLTSNQIKRQIEAKTLSGVNLLKNRTILSIDDPVGCFHLYDLNIYPVGCLIPTDEPINRNECSSHLSNVERQGLVLNGNGSTIENLQIFNSQGQTIYQQIGAVSESQILIPNQSVGIYFVTFLCNGLNRVEKIFFH
jgi:hypothetical protein